MDSAAGNGLFGDWERCEDNPVVRRGGPDDWDSENVEGAKAVYDERTDRYYVFYWGHDTDDSLTSRLLRRNTGGKRQIGVATTEDLASGPYRKHDANPVFDGSASGFTDAGVKMHSVVDDREATGTVRLYYTAENRDSSLKGIGMARSERAPFTEWEDLGCVLRVKDVNHDGATELGQPGVVRVDDTYLLAFWTRAPQRIGMAYSTDGRRWEMDEHNPVVRQTDLPGVDDDAMLGTPELFVLDDHVYLSVEAVDASTGKWRGYVLGSEASTAVDASRETSWEVVNPAPAYLDPEPSLDWESSENLAEFGTHVFGDVGDRTMYSFYESWTAKGEQTKLTANDERRSQVGVCYRHLDR